MSEETAASTLPEREWTESLLLKVRHLTRYEYSQPVTFTPHALYLRPRYSRWHKRAPNDSRGR